MFIFTDLWIVILFQIIFLVFYFGLEKFLLIENFSIVNYLSKIKNIFFGFVLGGVTILFTFITKDAFKNESFPIFVICILLILVLKNYKMSFYSLVPNLFFWIMTNEINANIYILITAMFLFFITWEIINILQITKKIKKYIIIFICLGLFLINFLISVYGFNQVPISASINYVSMPFVFFLLCYYLSNSFIKFTISSRLLHESNNYVYSNFYRTSLMKKAIENFITDKKPNRALLGLIKIETKKNYNPKEKQEITESLLRYSTKYIDSNSILFASVENYGFFVPIDNSKNIKMQLGEITGPKSVLTSWGERVSAKISIAFSIYGVHSNSIDDLVRYSTFTINTKENSFVSIFNFKKFRKYQIDYNNLSLLDKKIQLDYFDAKSIKIMDLDKKVFGKYGNATYTSDFSLKESADQIIYSFNWQNIFHRYFASFFVTKLKHEKRIIFDYSPTIFEDNFDLKEFLRLIKQQNVDPQSLYLVFRMQGISKIRNSKKVIQTTKLMLKEKINFIIDYKIDHDTANKLFGPVKYWLIDKETLEDKLSKDAESEFMIFENLTKEQHDQAIKKGIKYFNEETLSAK